MMIKKNWKKILLIALIIILSVCAGVYAEYLINALQVNYEKSDGTQISVKNALDELYSAESLQWIKPGTLVRTSWNMLGWVLESGPQVTKIVAYHPCRMYDDPYGINMYPYNGLSQLWSGAWDATYTLAENARDDLTWGYTGNVYYLDNKLIKGWFGNKAEYQSVIANYPNMLKSGFYNNNTLVWSSSAAAHGSTYIGEVTQYAYMIQNNSWVNMPVGTYGGIKPFFLVWSNSINAVN